MPKNWRHFYYTHYKVNILQAINNEFLKTDKKNNIYIYMNDFMKIERLSSSRVSEVPGYGKARTSKYGLKSRNVRGHPGEIISGE